MNPMIDPERIDAATAWVGTKISPGEDVGPSALILGVLYEWKRWVLDPNSRLPEILSKMLQEEASRVE